MGCPFPRAVDPPPEHLSLNQVLPGAEATHLSLNWVLQEDVVCSPECLILNQMLPGAVDCPPEHLSLNQVLSRAMNWPYKNQKLEPGTSPKVLTSATRF